MKNFEEIKSLNPDVLCVVAYGKRYYQLKILNRKIWSNKHYMDHITKISRATPIQWSVLNGDETTGI